MRLLDFLRYMLYEIGFSDMSLQSDVFNITVSMFTAESEEIRTAAAFAAGRPLLI